MSVIEFGLVAPIFFSMMFLMIEGGIYFYKKNHLKWVAYESSRALRTGVIQAAASPADAFEQRICDYAQVMFDCAGVYYDVRNFATIEDIDLPEATFTAAGVPTNFVFEPGEAGEINTVRLSIAFNFTTPLVDRLFNPDGGPIVTIANAIAKNEPF